MEKSTKHKIESGLEVTVRGDSIQIPQPPQTISKEQLLSQKSFWESRIDDANAELSKVNELLKLI